MVTVVQNEKHPTRLRAPYFSGQDAAELHRYFEPEFITRFQRDLQRHQINASSLGQWKQEDAFSKHDKKPVLRLPMHKSFYLVSCEVICDRLGHPALDPQKIKSAGFVIRRQTAQGEQSWMLEDDEVLGWESTPTGLRDPDVNRRFCCDKAPKSAGVVSVPIATYTGELTHPMHPIKVFDEKGKCHTILHGYLPLGGTYNYRLPQTKGSRMNPNDVFDAESLADFNRITAAQLLWPFGFRPVKGAATVDKTWTEDCARAVNKGKPTVAFFELLRTLVNRYHLGETNVAENGRLEDWATRQYFYNEAQNNQLKPENFTDTTHVTFMSARQYNLLDWLKKLLAESQNRLINYMAQQEKAADLNVEAFNFALLPAPASGSLSFSLYISPGDAQELRSLLDQRVLDNTLNKANEIPLPKFGQGKDDCYQAVSFVRIEDTCGHEQIVWADAGARTELFRVAAPFDANASRPSLIQMPSLSDLRGGFAKGVSMITPADTFDLLDKLNLKKGVGPDLVTPNDSPSLGIQWICSFSLPVITLIAMILLMIMISLLNIVFFWLPWVRICLPFPSIKKGG